MKTDECLARARRALLESERKVKSMKESGDAADDLVRKTRAVIATARRTMDANAPSRPASARRRRTR
jgi:hypothetical protein